MSVKSICAFAALACLAAPAQESSFVHRVGGRDAGRTTVTRAADTLRGEGAGGTEGARIVATVELASDGRVRTYERELRGKGDVLVGRVSVLATDEGARVRDAGPLGSRTRTAPGGGFDAVIDPAFPEALLTVLGERGRESFRALIVADAEIRTVLIEPRGDRARYVDVPGGGITARYDARGALESLMLPGAEAREMIRADAASRPSAPPPDAEEERFVASVSTEAGNVLVAGTILKPKKALDPPVLAVLIGDAGPLDRDGTGAGRRAPALRLLAEELARLGVATVRADKRGAGESAGPEPALADLASDALVALDKGRAATKAESRRTIFVGHGEGGIVAAEATARSPHVGGLVTLAGPGRSLADALEARLRARLKSAGESEETIETQSAVLRAEIADLRDAPDDRPPGPGRALLRDLARLDPAAQLTRLKTPALVLHAADDAEVPASHVSLLRAALAFSSQSRIRFQLLDRADHDFLLVPEARTAVRSAPGSADSGRPLHPSVAALVVDFVQRLN
jgi:uncharacterized protein